jgi:hypothetical protein
MPTTKLNPALNLYQKHYFVETPLDETDYIEPIQMKLYL